MGLTEPQAPKEASIKAVLEMAFGEDDRWEVVGNEDEIFAEYNDLVDALEGENRNLDARNGVFGLSNGYDGAQNTRLYQHLTIRLNQIKWVRYEELNGA